MPRRNFASRTRELQPFTCQKPPLPGHRYVEVVPQARKLLRELEKRTKRRPYVRSAYFRKEKIFFDYFWDHVRQKLPSDQARRLKFLPCALELLQKSHHDPLTFQEPDRPDLLLHRFAGKTRDGRLFYVQVREEKRGSTKQCLSVFPAKD